LAYIQTVQPKITCGSAWGNLGTLHVSSVTGLARFPGRILLSVPFQPGRPEWNPRNTAKMVNHKLLSFAAVVPLWTLVTLLIKLIRILLMWKYIQDKNYAILTAMLQKRSYFVEKVASQLPGLECSYGCSYGSLASHMNPSKFLRRKEKRGEILETEPARLTGLIWRGP